MKTKGRKKEGSEVRGKGGREGGRWGREVDFKYRARDEEAKEGPSSEGDTIFHSRGCGHFGGPREQSIEISSHAFTSRICCA